MLTKLSIKHSLQSLAVATEELLSGDCTRNIVHGKRGGHVLMKIFGSAAQQKQRGAARRPPTIAGKEVFQKCKNADI